MPELNCHQMGEWLDDQVGQCASWVDLGQRLGPPQQAHLSACAECRDRAVQLLEVERQLLALRDDPLPQLDLTAGILARIQAVQPPQRFPLLAWAPLLLLLACLLPDPGFLPAWMGWSVAWPEFSLAWPELPVPASWLDALMASTGLLAVAATLAWRRRPEVARG